MIAQKSCHQAFTIPLQEAVSVLLCQGLPSALQMAESEHQGRDNSVTEQGKIHAVIPAALAFKQASCLLPQSLHHASLMCM